MPHSAYSHLPSPPSLAADGLRQPIPDLLMLVLTARADDPCAVEAMIATARACLPKKTPAARCAVIHPFREIGPREQSDYHLTPHEVRLLKLLAEGHTYKTAAAALGVTRHTVSFHLRCVYEKLEVHSKSEAVGKALRSRLL